MSRIGLGLAAIGRPAYITTNREGDFGSDRSVGAFRARTWELLDAAYAAGIRYVDVARSYGLAEQFLSEWLADRGDVPDLVIGSKWGYTYVGAWDPDAPVQEVKDLSVETFERQYGETRAFLGDRLRLYQVHSLTIESGALDDQGLLAALARRRDQGLLIGITTTGPKQADTIRRRARGQCRRSAAVRIGAGHVEPARAISRPGSGRGLGRRVGGDREGGCGKWEADGRGRCGPARKHPRRHRRCIAPQSGRDRYSGRARQALGFGRPQRGCDRRAAREQRQRSGGRRLEIADLAEPAGEYWAARSARPWS